MNIIVETDRLILREFSTIDATHLYELNTDPLVIKHTGDSPFNSIMDTQKFLNNYTDYQKNGYGRWAVISKDSKEFLGWCGLKLNEENLVDIGFRFFRKEWNKGYATESAKASLEYGFITLDIPIIIGRASVDNKASIRVLEKLGMNFWKFDNCKGIENSAYYKIHRSEYTH